MRPVVPDVLPSHSRKPSVVEAVPPWSDPRSAAPTTFFLSRDDGHRDSSPTDPEATRDSMYGVQSLEETLNSLSASESRPPPEGDAIPDAHEDANDPPTITRRSTLKPFDWHDDHRQEASSRPITPLNLGSLEDPSSLPSSPKSTSNLSLKPLDDISITDEISSQALASGDEEEPVDTQPLPDSTSQLIMPSIKMPSRRPFTDRGKTMGRLKVLVAGAAGSGKTSLIKSIVQACEDIVHVDPLPAPLPPQSTRSRSRNRSRRTKSSPSISEVYASTKPYPSWWSDLEDSRVLRRRKSLGDVVLERNLCFVDSPGTGLTRAAQTDLVIQYMHQQLVRAMAAFDSVNADLQGMLGGNGGSQVDAILYLISEDTLSTDIECIRKLSELSNVIPVISKADLLTPSQISSIKQSFHAQAQNAGIKTFLFGDLPPEHYDVPRSPFAVSSVLSSDDDNMDASVLMSPDYVQPLARSELGLLIEKMFDHENLSWLRHSSAKKLAQHRAIPQKPLSAQNASLSRLSASGYSSPSTSSVPEVLVSYPGDGSSSYTLARVSDYTQREERMAQVRLAKWAADLQRSLQNERERYAALARGERAVWLTERLNECVIDGTLVPITQTPGFSGLGATAEKSSCHHLVRTGSGRKADYCVSSLSRHDPFGLMLWNDDLRRKGWVTIQVVGSFGVVGGLALWLSKSWGVSSQSLSDWRFNWFGSD
ncbi:conserved hypothetical protein [Paecilomyces variotii No. 5]|uniref:Septin-type G domain-containing protein n=1 Tax=Byssochlamys spectabilis (strain No. 5 / NBRC 109023) TaxID=1356009 RepID=V5FVK4_BYSSN|nr:conserved hypothetical protein [Paecilomyces variotii No. 5]